MGTGGLEFEAMEAGIENFAAVIVENTQGEVLLVRKVQQYAYAIPWCRIVPGRSLQQCIIERVRDLTGISIHPVFLGPSEHIQENSHFISFDHVATVDTTRQHYTRKDLDYLWIEPGNFHAVPLVPLSQSLLKRYCLERGIRVE